MISIELNGFSIFPCAAATRLTVYTFLVIFIFLERVKKRG